MKEKKYCPTHHLYYTNTECPMCFQERMNRYDKKFGKKEEEKKPKNEECLEVTQDSLEKLKAKFNKK